jgi:hypothetical protein
MKVIKKDRLHELDLGLIQWSEETSEGNLLRIYEKGILLNNQFYYFNEIKKIYISKSSMYILNGKKIAVIRYNNGHSLRIHIRRADEFMFKINELRPDLFSVNSDRLNPAKNIYMQFTAFMIIGLIVVVLTHYNYFTLFFFVLVMIIYLLMLGFHYYSKQKNNDDESNKISEDEE